jgi:hypothetical protein
MRAVPERPSESDVHRRHRTTPVNRTPAVDAGEPDEADLRRPTPADPMPAADVDAAPPVVRARPVPRTARVLACRNRPTSGRAREADAGVLYPSFK